jgi:TolA-binding protein
MATDNPQQRGSSQVERWFDHVVRGLTVIAIVAGFTAVTGMRTQLAVMSTQMQSMNERINDMRANSSDRYTASEARRELTPIIDRIADHEGRLRVLERGTVIPGGAN